MSPIHHVEGVLRLGPVLKSWMHTECHNIDPLVLVSREGLLHIIVKSLVPDLDSWVFVSDMISRFRQQ